MNFKITYLSGKVETDSEITMTPRKAAATKKCLCRKGSPYVSKSCKAKVHKD